MFRLSEALRRQRKNARAPGTVATVVATLSPRSRPDATGLVATVAAVANPEGEGEAAALAALLDSLQAQGAQLSCQGQALWLRPGDWAQLAAVSQHWLALRARLEHMNTQKKEHGHGPDRSA